MTEVLLIDKMSMPMYIKQNTLFTCCIQTYRSKKKQMYYHEPLCIYNFAAVRELELVVEVHLVED